MFKTLTLKTVDDKEIEVNFLSTGTTAYRFKQIFKKDLMKCIIKLTSNGDDLNSEADLIVAYELAFIMNKQAEKRDMNTLTYDEYLSWIDGFDSASLFANIADFIKIYTGSKDPTSSSKKDEEP